MMAMSPTGHLESEKVRAASATANSRVRYAQGLASMLTGQRVHLSNLKRPLPRSGLPCLITSQVLITITSTWPRRLMTDAESPRVERLQESHVSYGLGVFQE
jgi:hypothetical protein